MQIELHQEYQDTAAGRQAQELIKSCVHCGFCLATCPTYQQLGEECDSPRGRIYLIKELFETAEASAVTQTHLDRCLTCRSCETTCPSGMEYGRLIDLGRVEIEHKVGRGWREQTLRWGLRQILPYPTRVAVLMTLARLVRPLLPASLKQKVPARQKIRKRGSLGNQTAAPAAERTMLALSGCVQSAVTPQTQVSATRVLAKLGIHLRVEPKAGCCGALSHHLAAEEEGRDFMRQNIDAWWPSIEAGAEAIVVSASGCGAMIKEYGELLSEDPKYCDKARRVSELAKDLSEVLLDDGGEGGEGEKSIERLQLQPDSRRTAVHCPCTLQHAQGLPDSITRILQQAGVELANTQENHLCCGSAGAYSLLQPEMADDLMERKLAALSMDNPQRIVTANIGCQLHLQRQAEVPVNHWIELLDDLLPD